MIELYVLDGCPYCAMALDTLKKRKISYKSTVVPQSKKNEYKKKSNMETFPQIFIKSSTKRLKIGGMSDLTNYFNCIDNIKNNKLNINILTELLKH